MSVVSVNNVIAANNLNSNNLRKAKQKKECEKYIKSFDYESPSIEQMQTYSQCVDVVYPNVDMSAEKILPVSILVFIAIFCTVMLYGVFIKNARNILQFTLKRSLVLFAFLSFCFLYTLAYVG